LVAGVSGDCSTGFSLFCLSRPSSNFSKECANMDVTYNDLRQLMRQYANQLGDLLREIKRIHVGVVEGVSAPDLLQSRIPSPEPGQTLRSDGVVVDGNGNPVADYSRELYECNLLLSAFNGLRAAIALLENDAAYLERPGVIGVDHWNFIQRFADWHKRGGL